MDGVPLLIVPRDKGAFYEACGGVVRVSLRCDALLTPFAVPRRMSEFRIRRRTRLKTKQARALQEEVGAVFGEMALWSESAAVEVGEAPGMEVWIVDGVVHGLRDASGPFMTVRGLLAYRPTTRWATVDMGAVRHVHNGADVMAPGIVEADPELQPGDWVWVRDERNKQPLAVGKCLMAGSEMGPADKGKAITSVHHLGDKLWDLDA